MMLSSVLALMPPLPVGAIASSSSRATISALGLVSGNGGLSAASEFSAGGDWAGAFIVLGFDCGADCSGDLGFALRNEGIDLILLGGDDRAAVTFSSAVASFGGLVLLGGNVGAANDRGPAAGLAPSMDLEAEDVPDDPRGPSFLCGAAV